MVKCFYLGSISCCYVRKPFDYLKILNEVNYIQIQGHVIDFIFCKKKNYGISSFTSKSNWYGDKNVIHILKWNILFCLCRQNDFYRVKQYREIHVISKDPYSAFLMEGCSYKVLTAEGGVTSGEIRDRSHVWDVCSHLRQVKKVPKRIWNQSVTRWKGANNWRTLERSPEQHEDQTSVRAETKTLE